MVTGTRLHIAFIRTVPVLCTYLLETGITSTGCSGVPRGIWCVQPHPRKSEDIDGVLDRISKKNRRLDFLLQFTVFSYGCNLLNKGFF